MPIDVKCLGSGSKGNSYAVDDGTSALLLEAGIRSKKILMGYEPILPRVAGCLITHGHQDHAKYASDLAAAGIDLYMTSGTCHEITDKFGAVDRPYRVHVVRKEEQFQLASWIVLPFETEHDAMEPCGYLLYSTAAHEKLLFATDTYYIPAMFRALNVIMVECNYSMELLDKSIAAGRTPEVMKPRLLQSHFSLENVKDFIRANDMSTVRRIYLIHISHNNGDPEQFKQEIQRLTGKPVTAF